MGPKKKEKSKEIEWLECSLCQKWITPSDADLHSQSCDSQHPFIFNYSLMGKVVKAEEVKDEEGIQVTMSVKGKDNTVWLSIPTMSLCGLSIGQNIVLDGNVVKRAWPLKGLPLSHVALSKGARDEIDVDEGSLITLTKLVWDDEIVHSVVLQLMDYNSIYEKETFGSFLSSHLDGTFISLDSQLFIKYFGQLCRCAVINIEIGKKDTALNYSSSQLVPANMSSTLKRNHLRDSQTSKVQNVSPCSLVTETQMKEIKSHDSDLKYSTDIPKLTESFTEMDVSDASSVDSSQQETPVKLKYPNLGTPLKPEIDRNFSNPSSFQIFGKIVSGYTRISLQTSSKNLKDEKFVEKSYSLNDLGGISKESEKLKTRIFQALQPGSFSKCILVQGPPGTGKSLFVGAMASHLQMHTVYVAGTDIWSKLFGEAEANLRKIFSSAEERSPAIIIFDDLHVICPKRSQNYTGQQEHRIVGTLLSLIDRVAGSGELSSPKVVIIGITNDVDAVDPALRRAGRFGCEVEIGVPNAAQRAEILSILLKGTKHNLTPDEISTVAHNSHGYVGADLAALVNEAVIHSMNKQGTSPLELAQVFITLNDLVNAGHHIKPSALREIQLEVPQVRWTDIGGMEEVKMRLKESVEVPLIHPELYHNLGIEPPKGLLMYGPPGCSKTMIAKAVATECHLNFLAVKGPELFNQYVGESEKNIRQIFHKARSAAPSVIFFDEIDAIAGTRGSSSGGSSGVDDRVLTQLLTEMDGLERLKDVFIMAATNRPDKIDRALLRPGRFDSVIYVPLPDDNTRREILQNKLKKMGISEDLKIEDLVEATVDYSGAEVIQVCQEAALCALRENINTRKVEQKHFDEALQKVLPQIDVELLKIYQEFSSPR